MAASASDLLQEVGIETATTLDAPGYTISDTSITVVSTTNWPTATGVTFAIDAVDANGDQVANSYNEYVGTVASATSVTNVSHVNGTDRDYDAGTSTRVYIPVSAERENRIVEWGLVEHDQDGTHDAITTTTINNAGTLAQTGVATFTTHLDINDSSTAIRDSSDNELLKFAKTATAVNELTVTNNSTGNPPTLSATGGDTNIALKLSGKGTGAVQMYVNSVDQLGAWQTWAPTYANVTVGSGTLVAKYCQIGKLVFCEWNLLCDVGTTAVGSSVTISLPVAAASRYTNMDRHPVGQATGVDDGTKVWNGVVLIDNSTSVAAIRWDDGTGGLDTTITFTEATGDTFSASWVYEAA